MVIEFKSDIFAKDSPFVNVARVGGEFDVLPQPVYIVSQGGGLCAAL